MNLSPTHTGKIGRLPSTLRAELGRRLENHHPARQLVRWLNRQPQVRHILKEQFAGRPITTQNLSHWKHTGHPDWLRREHARHAAADLVEHAHELDPAAPGPKLSDHFATVLASEMTRLAAQLLEPETDPEKRWHRLCHINRELACLRREDHRAERLALQREQRQREIQQATEAEAKRLKQEKKSQLIQELLEPFQRGPKIQGFKAMGAQTDLAEVLVQVIECINYDQSYAHLEPELNAAFQRARAAAAAAKTPPKPQKSNPLQPNPTPKQSAPTPERRSPTRRVAKSKNACQTENRRSQSSVRTHSAAPSVPSVPSTPPKTAKTPPQPVATGNNPPPVSTVFPIMPQSVSSVLPINPQSAPLQPSSIASKEPNSEPTPAKTSPETAPNPVSDAKIQPPLTEEEAYNLWFRRLHYQIPQEWETWSTTPETTPVSPPTP